MNTEIFNTGGPWDDPAPSSSNSQEKVTQLKKDFFNKPPEAQKSLLWIALLLLFGGWILSGFYQVNPDEKGIVLRFGKWVKTTDEGWRYHYPYPIEQVLKPKVTVTNQIKIGFGSLDESLMLTGDRNIVDLSFTVQWRIQDPIEFLFNIRDPQKTIKAASESVMRDTVGQMHIDKTIAEGRGEIESTVKEKLQTLLNEYKAGVFITAVSLKRVDPPKQVIEDFLEVERAQSDQGRIVNQSEAYRNEILPKARGEAAEIVALAKGKKAAVVAIAQGESSKFLALAQEYKKAPKVMKKRLLNETLEEIYGSAKKVIVDQKSGMLPHMALPAVTH